MPRNLTGASTMNGSNFTGQLTSNAGRFEALVQGVSEAQAPWKPDAETWSILEIVNHLYDEEREDFRVRLDNILHHQEREWAPIDPEGWVTERQYSERELPASLTKLPDRAKRVSEVAGVPRFAGLGDPVHVGIRLYAGWRHVYLMGNP